MTTTIGSVDLNALSDLYNDANQYFWFESNPDATYGAGVHLTLSPDTSFVANPSGQNVLINTDGISFRNGLLPMMTLDNDSLDFNVINTTAGTYNNVASFGSTAIVIGEEANANLHLTFNNLSMVDKDGTKFFEVGDNRNAEGVATIKHTAMVSVGSTGSATVTVNSNISSIVSVYADSVQLSSSRYSFNNKTVTINGLTANSQTSIEITYTTKNSSLYLTFGNRDSSGNIGNYSIAEGIDVIASGAYSHAEGQGTTASGAYSHAEGQGTTARGMYSHAEGRYTTARGMYSHAEGRYTTASEDESHTEGYNTTASGYASHAEGYYTDANEWASHAEGDGTTASAKGTHAGGLGTVADGEYMTAIGKHNTENSGKAFVVGNGASNTNRSDAFTVDWDGNTVMKGGLTLGTALSIANGGTGATTAAAARTNLGLNRNIITAKPSGDVTRSGTGDSKILVVKANSVGDKFTVTSGSVYVGSGISKVLVSAHAKYQCTTGVKNLVIRKNGTSIAEINQNTNFSSNLALPLAITPVLIDVTEGDYFDLWWYGATNDVMQAALTRMTIEAVE